MSIPLEQGVASVMKYVSENDVDGGRLYYDEFPEQYYVPGIYFPVPLSEGKKATLQSYMNDIRLEVWFLAKSDWEAHSRAANVRDALLLDNMCIPIVHVEGYKTSKGIRTKEPSIRKRSTGIVVLTIPIMDYFKQAPEENPQLSNNFIFRWHHFFQRAASIGVSTDTKTWAAEFNFSSTDTYTE